MDKNEARVRKLEKEINKQMKEIEKMNDSSVYEKEEYGRRGWESERKRTRKTRERERENVEVSE